MIFWEAVQREDMNGTDEPLSFRRLFAVFQKDILHAVRWTMCKNAPPRSCKCCSFLLDRHGSFSSYFVRKYAARSASGHRDIMFILQRRAGEY
jgi:hypothetical protein